jgi:pyruvate dehydrogenase E1 component alpha subunit
VERARAGEGPTLIEAKTYRYFHHSGVGGAKIGQVGAFGLAYRSDRELRHWLGRDPIKIFRNTLVSTGILTGDQADSIEAKVKQDIDNAFAEAQKSKIAPLDEALRTVYASGDTVPATQLG